MAKLLSEEELEGRLDCFGEFECTDDICLRCCGVNIACASANQQPEEPEWLDEGLAGLPDLELD
jgi:hypothetical protein